ncbi:unnamed protein product [Owenia fusiformis]|uniref:Uncharacterized protein n=1 Tax=Owenia fusiformis TaxID=6347 RepID=A0A8J1TDP1_OWEFU|nr:unnamed protein product [Owenia fusiformis]
MPGAVPPSLKAINHYLKLATEYDKRDQVVSYYCRMYAVQRGIKTDSKSPDCKQFLFGLMDELEKMKVTLKDNDAITSEVVAQAHIENVAHKLFLWADNEDRAARFNKNVVKSFYSSSILMDVVQQFGELSEEVEKNKKYAKWKAAYIHKCLQSGETPIPGPLNEEGEEEEGGAVGGEASQPGPSGYQPPADQVQPPVNQNQPPANQYQPPANQYQPPANQYQPPPTSQYPPPTNLPTPNNNGQYPGGSHAPPTTPSDPPRAAGGYVAPPAQPQQAASWTPPPNAGNVQLKADDYQKAMKYCKYASSALQYEDTKTAVDNLTKALTLITTGQDPGK